MLPFLLGPWGKYMLFAMALICLVFFAVHAIEKNASLKERLDSENDLSKRQEKVIESDHFLLTHPERVFSDDKYERR